MECTGIAARGIVGVLGSGSWLRVYEVDGDAPRCPYIGALPFEADAHVILESIQLPARAFESPVLAGVSGLQFRERTFARIVYCDLPLVFTLVLGRPNMDADRCALLCH